ncbi:DUF4179 domain-containing protein [Anaerobacillus sp. CMMVII]|uniref:DUF4179 domain-containing protein n=1 Tax=Anaerobacillus sp. CMMVII TaxID=2755588 RepID=UPI0021B796E5|nr:DUF4179 domain-containing protein [Anaerobacillus sp. CMMVII]MCT8136689.1 DUF4179 domain-containing protein [Anaerobacillus sp. CMMVII]
MNNIEKQLEREKQRIDAMSAPPELEGRLRNTLNTKSQKPRRFTSLWKMVAAALVLFTIVGYHYNGFAYYGKKLFGFDELVNGTLQQLNEAGMGQVIDKTISLENGTELTIDGIMTDANRTILYYTLTNPNGVEYGDDFSPSEITGFLTKAYVSSGTGLLNEEGTELKGMMDFDAVSPFAKKLTLHFRHQLENGQMLQKDLTFPYNPNKALQAEIKQTINKKIQFDKGTATFKTLSATPTMTVIKGTLNVENFDRLPLGLHGIDLIANGKPVEILGSSSSSSLRGTKFEIRYDALPEQLNSLELHIKEFIGYATLQETYSIQQSIALMGEYELLIKDVKVTPERVELTIATDEFVLLDGVSIGTDTTKTPLLTTIGQIDTKQADGRMLKERTLLFETTTMPDTLFIEGIHYLKQYDERIAIPIN